MTDAPGADDRPSARAPVDASDGPEAAGQTGRQDQSAPADPGSAPAPEAAALPPAIRKALTQLVSKSLPGLTPRDVPSAIRPALAWRPGAMPAGFADRLLGALGDDTFRAVLASTLEQDEQTAQRLQSLSDAEPLAAEDGALLFIARPAGWVEQLSTLMTASPDQESALVRSLQRELADTQARLEKSRQRRGRDVAAATEQAERVQRDQAATIDRLRGQLAAAQQAQREAEQAASESGRQGKDDAREARRLRAQLTQARAEIDRLRLEHRDGQVTANSRAQMLLAVLQESLAGLVDELAIPAATPAPGDLVPAAAPEPTVSVQRLHDTGELMEVLALPRCHLLVDGYNLSKGMWPTLSLQQQRDRLIAALGALQARTGAEVTVVFDGAEVAGVPAVSTKSVRVRFSEPGDPADRVLVALVAAEPSGRPMVVASSDAAVASGARRAGARTVERGVLADLLRV